MIKKIFSVILSVLLIVLIIFENLFLELQNKKTRKLNKI